MISIYNLWVVEWRKTLDLIINRQSSTNTTQVEAFIGFSARIPHHFHVIFCGFPLNFQISTCFTGWWLSLRLWKMMEFVSWDDDIPNIWKNKKCSKPPTSLVYRGVSHEPSQFSTPISKFLCIFSKTIHKLNLFPATNTTDYTSYIDVYIYNIHVLFSGVAAYLSRNPVVLINKLLHKS